MQGYKETVEIVTALQKQGKAIVVVDLVAYANDLDFSKNPPSCRVTVTVTDPRNSNETVHTAVADIPTTTPPYTHEFTIPVETVVKRFKRMLRSAKPRALNVRIVAEPINGFERWYESDERTSGMQVEAGSKEPRSVSLKPKQERSRLGFTLEK